MMDGIRMAKEIRELSKETRIIVITAVSDINRILEAIDIGINHYVLKPIDHNKLVSVIKSCMTYIEQERQVREQLEFFRKLSRAVDQGPVANIITDTEGTIEFVNPGFTRLTGYTFVEAVGKNMRMLKSGETPQVEYQRLWKTISAGEEWWGNSVTGRRAANYSGSPNLYPPSPMQQGRSPISSPGRKTSPRGSRNWKPSCKWPITTL